MFINEAIEVKSKEGVIFKVKEQHLKLYFGDAVRYNWLKWCTLKMLEMISTSCHDFK